VPIDIQKTQVVFEYPEIINIPGYKPTLKGHEIQIKKIADAISSSCSPVICCGGGVISGGATEELLQLVENFNIPVVSTLMGIGCIPSSHRLYMGMIGSHGVYAANYAINNADLIILMGARVGDRAINSAKKIIERAKIVHIDIDPAEIGKNIDVTIPVVGELKGVISGLNRILKPCDVTGWNENLISIKSEVKNTIAMKTGYICPKYLLNILSQTIDEKTIITTEVGQNQIWAANHIKIKAPRRFLTSGGLGTMGYGLPAAVGAKFGEPEANVIVISGDGSFQMSMQELGTIKAHNLDIKMIVFNNSRLGMVRELQKNLYNERYSEVFLENNPDFVKIFEAYGFGGERISDNNQVEDALNRMKESKGPYLLECVVDPEENSL
jgi:acetolactate synthase-1/2/3 large subunit